MAGVDTAPPSEQQAILLLLHFDHETAIPLLGALASDRYAVVACPSGAFADRWAEELQPDLVLLIPPADVAKLVTTCTTMRERVSRPIVVLSRHREEGAVARALSSGIDEYLSLPIGEQELTARLDALLRRVGRPGVTRDLSRVGGLVLSAADLSAEYSGRKVTLSPTEFRLLSCLASLPGKVLTHDTLMSRVWGAEYVDSRHYLHLYIRYLREKLEEDPTRPRLILSEWGVGYRLQPDAQHTGELPAHSRSAS